MYVIGHTHYARLLVDHLPGGRLLVTMDCGGWIENCTVYNDKAKHSLIAPSSQVGVQCRQRPPNLPTRRQTLTG